MPTYHTAHWKASLSKAKKVITWRCAKRSNLCKVKHPTGNLGYCSLCGLCNNKNADWPPRLSEKKGRLQRCRNWPSESWITFEIMAGSPLATWSASSAPVQTPLKRRSAISLKRGFWCDMAVVALYGTACRDLLRQHGHSQTHSGVDRWLNFFTDDATSINCLRLSQTSLRSTGVGAV